MPTNNESKLEKSLVETIKNSDLKSLGSTAGEIAIDSILNDGLLKEIPIVNTITSIAKTGSSVKDYLFTKKLILFLFSIAELKQSERQKMIRKLETDSKYKKTVGEHIILLLDRLDNFEKPVFIAKAFIAYCRGEIGFVELQRLNNAIERVLVYDLPQLEKFSHDIDDDKFEISVEQNFVNSGLAYVKSGYGVGGVHPTEICNLFLKYILSDSSKK